MKSDKKAKIITALLFLYIVLNIYLYTSKNKQNNIHYMVDRVASSIYENDISDMEGLIKEGYDREQWKGVINELHEKHVEADMKGYYDIVESYGTFITLELDKEIYILHIYPDINGNLYIDDIFPIEESENKGLLLK